MSRLLEGVYRQHVPMLPDASVVWEVTEVPSEQLKVYTAPGADESAVRMAMKAARQPLNRHELEFVGGGKYSTAWKYGNMVLKKFNNGINYDDFDGNTCDLNGVRANVALSRGLDKIGPLVVSVGEEQEAVYKYRTPEYFALVSPYKNWDYVSPMPDASPVWLMSYEDGHHLGQLAPAQQRHMYFNTAARAAGLASRFFDWDDHEENTVIRQLSDDPADVEYVKLDVMAYDRMPY